MLVADVERSAADVVGYWAASDAKLVTGYICRRPGGGQADKKRSATFCRA